MNMKRIIRILRVAILPLFLGGVLSYNSPRPTLAQISPEEIKAVWDPNKEPDLAGYTVYWGKASRAYTDTLDVGNVTECLFDISEWPDGVYFFAVTASDTSGNESNFSNEATYNLDHTPPQPPGGCKVFKIG